jgi:hypothetical protein
LAHNDPFASGQPAEEADHLDRGQGRVPSLVTGLPASTVDGLAGGREHDKRQRQGGREQDGSRQSRQTASV